MARSCDNCKPDLCLFAGGGSGGGGGGGGPLLITITHTTYEEEGHTYDRYETDRTAREIIEAGPTAYRVFYEDVEEVYYYLQAIAYRVYEGFYFIMEYNYSTGSMDPMQVENDEILKAESLDSHLVAIVSRK